LRKKRLNPEERITIMDFSVIRWRFNFFCALFGITIGFLFSDTPTTFLDVLETGVVILFLCGLLDILFAYFRRRRLS